MGAVSRYAIFGLVVERQKDGALVGRSSPGRGAVFATTGQVTPVAAAEIKKLGWKIVQLKPVR